ncbi:hypothetical protein ROHU_003765 [Labeo rohita]|uniref:Uncharacterized protein n=1 Tax=Labeo rohita TaxID=84645 RepID=A0A498LN56_LABRO|nr:hypothetical protein ROHU_031499 [Labeo rohita]RXN35491.1 hypothetical protein ROHU_003765 [Labeo rohita]
MWAERRSADPGPPPAAVTCMKNTGTEINSALMGAQSLPTLGGASEIRRANALQAPSAAGTVLDAALSRSTSKSEKKGNFIEWTLSCAGRDVWERQEVGPFSITDAFLPRLRSHAFNLARTEELQNRTSDSPQLLFFKQTA